MTILLGWRNMPVNTKYDARYVQRILNWETLGLSSLPQVEQSTNRNSRQESVIPFTIIPLLLHLCLYVQALLVHTLLIDTIRYHSWILATLYWILSMQVGV